MSRRVLVTGAARGLGAEIARTLACAGYDLVLHYRSSDPELIVEECRRCGVDVRVVQGDFSTHDGLEAFVAQVGDVYGLVNNVGSYSVGEAEIAQVVELFQTNLFTPYMLMRALATPLMQYQGTVVNIGFVGLDCGRGSVYCPVYLAAKEALLSLTRSFAKEWAPHHVRVNMVSPGYLDNAVDLPDVAKLPMGRPASCSEAARAVAFLVDPASAYITGQNLDVAGGIKL